MFMYKYPVFLVQISSYNNLRSVQVNVTVNKTQFFHSSSIEQQQQYFATTVAHHKCMRHLNHVYISYLYLSMTL